MLNRECSFPIDSIAGIPPAHPQTSYPIQYLEWLTYIVNKTHEFAFQNLNQAAISWFIQNHIALDTAEK